MSSTCAVAAEKLREFGRVRQSELTRGACDRVLQDKPDGTQVKLAREESPSWRRARGCIQVVSPGEVLPDNWAAKRLGAVASYLVRAARVWPDGEERKWRPLAPGMGHRVQHTPRRAGRLAIKQRLDGACTA